MCGGTDADIISYVGLKPDEDVLFKAVGSCASAEILILKKLCSFLKHLTGLKIRFRIDGLSFINIAQSYFQNPIFVSNRLQLF